MRTQIVSVILLIAPVLAAQDGPAKTKPKAKTTTMPTKIIEVDGYPISIQTVEPRPIVSIRIQSKIADLTMNFGKYLPKLFAYAAQNGGECAGQPLAIYHSAAKKGMVDVEMACQLVKPIKGKGEIKAGKLYGGKVATTFHLGSYHDLSKAHAALQKWVKQNKHAVGGAPWEVYTSDPTKVKPSEVRTDVFCPIAKPVPAEGPEDKPTTKKE